MLVTLSFLFSVLLSGAGSINFGQAAGSPFSVAALRPKAVAIGDFNNDGKLDLAVANLRCDPAKDPRGTCTEATTAGQVSILLGDGHGRFTEFMESEVRRSPFEVAAGPEAIAVKDLDGDGNQDFVTAHPESDKIVVRQGNGKVDFYSTKDFMVGKAPSSLFIGDFNNDGIPDIATANIVGDSVSILLGKLGKELKKGEAGRRWEVQLSTEYNVGNGPQSVVVSDFNGDGNQDVAAANADKEESISILLGDGKGNFSISHIGLGEMPKAIAAADFNQDGKQDLATANTAGDTVFILLGNGDGTFGSPKNFPAGIDPIAIAVADFDKDGDQELVVVSGSKNNISILLNDGSARFALAGSYNVGEVPLSVAIGDFNGDGKPDIATANQGSNDVTVLLNRSP